MLPLVSTNESRGFYEHLQGLSKEYESVVESLRAEIRTLRQLLPTESKTKCDYTVVDFDTGLEAESSPFPPPEVDLQRDAASAKCSIFTSLPPSLPLPPLRCPEVDWQRDTASAKFSEQCKSKREEEEREPPDSAFTEKNPFDRTSSSTRAGLEPANEIRDMSSMRKQRASHAAHLGNILLTTRSRHAVADAKAHIERNWQEFIFMILIFSNQVCIGSFLQYHAVVGREWAGESAVELAFSIVFVIEVLVRIFNHGWKDFSRGPDRYLNMFDTSVVCITTLAEFGGRINRNVADVDMLKSVLAFRVIRMIRVIHFLETMNLCPSSIQLFLLSIVKGCRLLMWIFLICLTMVYVLAVLISYGTLPHCYRNDGSFVDDDHVDNAPEYRDVCYHFGTLQKSCVSIYQAILGGIPWYTLYNSLKSLDTQYRFFFMAFITFVFTILLNIISAVFVCQVIAVSESLKQQNFYEDQVKKREAFIDNMLSVFQELDVNTSGTLSKEEMVEMFANRKMSAILASMDLDIHSASTLFDLLDMDASGCLDIDEFVLGCLKLQGKARAIDVERVSRSLQQIENILRGDVLTDSKEDAKEYGDAVEETREFHSAIARTEYQSKFFGSQILDAASLSDVSQAARLRTRKRTRMERTEMRAMLISELEDVLTMIETACVPEMWTDASSGEVLTPEKVNLYQYNYHVISPCTADSSITLKGLKHGQYSQGDLLTQSCDGRVLGEATVLVDTEGTEVQVNLTKGQLLARSSSRGSECRIEINGCDFGVPEVVVNKDAVSYKELVSSTQARPDWFCTHWWGEPIFDFVACCRAHSQARKSDAYWVCAYANRQHDLGMDLTADPEESSFRRSMKLAKGILLVLDDNAMPFQRIWCDFELYKVVSDANKMLDIITFRDSPQLLTERPLEGEHDTEKTQRECEFPLRLLFEGTQVSLELGQASWDQDKVNILESMGKNQKSGIFDNVVLQENMDRANKALRSYFALAAWPQALRRHSVRNFSFGKVDDEDTIHLPEVLAADENRESVRLTLGGIQEVNDGEMESIAIGLPKGLKELNLSFESCFNITDIGVSALAKRLKHLPLQRLRLDFVSCRRLTDAALNVLAINFPNTLTDVRLDFAFCHLITKVGVIMLAAKLPNSVKKFIGTFRGTKCDENFDSVRKLRRLS